MDADQIIDRRRLKRRLAIWRTLAIVALVAALGALTARFALPGRDHVARLAVNGIITEDAERDRAVDALIDDDSVKALIVAINSPGGTTAGSESLYHALSRVAEALPVVAVIGTLGTSGGYIVAIASDHVVARETSITGSIGVLVETAEFSGLLEKLGVRAEARRSAPLKGQPSPLEPMSDEVRAALDAVVQDSYAWFVDLVRTRRGLSDAEAARVSDGRVFTGRQAMASKLIDAIGGEREARSWLESERKVSADLPVEDLRYGDKASLVGRLTDSMAEKVLSFEPLILDGLVSVWHPR
jgi:protease IV